MENRRSDSERRSRKDRRRLNAEQIVGWVRVGKWRSACLENLMIAKYLKP